MIYSSSHVLADLRLGVKFYPELQKLDELSGQSDHLRRYVMEHGLFFDNVFPKGLSDTDAIRNGIPIKGSGVILGPSRSGKSTLLTKILGFSTSDIISLREPEIGSFNTKLDAWTAFSSALEQRSIGIIDSLKDYVYENDNLISSGLSTSYIPLLTPLASQCLAHNAASIFIINLSSGDLKVFKTLWDRLWGSLTYILVPAPLIKLGAFFLYHRDYYTAEKIILCYARENGSIVAEVQDFATLAAYVVMSAPFYKIDKASSKDKTSFNAAEQLFVSNPNTDAWAPVSTVLANLLEKKNNTAFFKGADRSVPSSSLNSLYHTKRMGFQ